MTGNQDEGGGASRSTDPASGSSAATDVSLREYIMLHVIRLEGMLAAEVELRRARREDDLEAVHKSERSIEMRLAGMNELRSQIESERGRYSTKDDLAGLSVRFDTAMHPVDQFIVETRTRLQTLSEAKVDQRAGIGTVLGIVGGMAAFLTIVVVLANFAFATDTPTTPGDQPVVTVTVPDITPK